MVLYTASGGVALGPASTYFNGVTVCVLACIVTSIMKYGMRAAMCSVTVCSDMCSVTCQGPARTTLQPEVGKAGGTGGKCGSGRADLRYLETLA